MSTLQYIGIGLVVAAFIAAKIYVLISHKTGIGIATLGAILLIFSEPANAA